MARAIGLLGPGLITGASDDDPSGIGTYSQAGAAFGFATLWMALFTFPLMTAVQYVCAKVGQTTGQGLAGILRRHYPRWVLYPAVLALFVANTINVGADLGAVAAAVSLIVPIPAVWLVAPLAAGIVAVQIFSRYRLIESIFKWLTLALLAYIGSAFFSHPNLGEVLRSTIVPTFRLDAHFISIVVAILGTTISPYLFFWQASQEVEEEKAEGKQRLEQRRGTTDRKLVERGWDVTVGMFFSNLVMYFIILATGATLFANGKTQVQSATDAAQALTPIAGPAASFLLAAGLIGAGMLAIPVLSGAAGYAISEAFGWRFGLDADPRRAWQFYAVIAISTAIGMAINFAGINVFDALVATAVINGLLAPPLLVLIMRISANERIMGSRTNGTLTSLLGWITTALMTIAGIALVVTWLTGQS